MLPFGFTTPGEHYGSSRISHARREDSPTAWGGLWFFPLYEAVTDCQVTHHISHHHKFIINLKEKDMKTGGGGRLMMMVVTRCAC